MGKTQNAGRLGCVNKAATRSPCLGAWPGLPLGAGQEAITTRRETGDPVRLGLDRPLADGVTCTSLWQTAQERVVGGHLCSGSLVAHHR